LLDTLPREPVTSRGERTKGPSCKPCGSILSVYRGKLSSTGDLVAPLLFRTSVQLLIAVINHEEKLDQILSGMVELGITGATIINSEGMGRVLSHDVPIFAGLETLALRSRPRNQTIFSVIKEDEKVEGAFRLLREICGDLDDPATGIAFTIPITRVIGLAPELGADESDKG
jgi:nitrogen regulatory protein PII